MWLSKQEIKTIEPPFILVAHTCRTCNLFEDEWNGNLKSATKQNIHMIHVHIQDILTGDPNAYIQYYKFGWEKILINDLCCKWERVAMGILRLYCHLNIQKVSWDTSETRNMSTFSRRAVRAWLCETRNVISFSRRSIGAPHETRHMSTFLRSVRASCETQNMSTFSRRLVGASQVISLLPWVWKNPHFIKKVTLSQFELRAGCARRDVGKSPNVPTWNVPWPYDPKSAGLRVAQDLISKINPLHSIISLRKRLHRHIAGRNYSKLWRSMETL